MKKSFSAVIYILLAASAAAQAPKSGEPVSIGFVNAVGVAAKTEFRIDGNSIRPTGFAEGRFVESFGVTEGTHVFSFTNSACEPLSQPIEVKAGSSPLYILYKATTRSPDGRVTNKLKLTGVPPQARSRGRQFVGFYASENAGVTIRVNGATVMLDALKLSPLGEGTLEVQTVEPRPERYNPSEWGNYVLVVFDGSGARPKQALVQMPTSD